MTVHVCAYDCTRACICDCACARTGARLCPPDAFGGAWQGRHGGREAQVRGCACIGLPVLALLGCVCVCAKMHAH